MRSSVHAATKPASAAGGHTERHFRSSDTVRDIVLGMADGLTVPFALAAGISGALNAASGYGTALIVTAGLAEIAAGSIAMGLGGYLSARAERDHYEAERRREETEIIEKPAHERREIIEIMETYGVSEQDTAPLIAALERQPERWRDFMMRFELGLEEPDPKRARQSAITIALAYVVGGFVPLAPYLLTNSIATALGASTAVTLAALFGFGWVKGRYTGTPPATSAVQTFVIGGLAAGAAFAIARLVS
ncbi:MAG: VIT1/CCC1 transporter family protein [Burkholderiaceae bacterium]